MKIIHSTVFFFKLFLSLQLIFQIAVNFLATVSPGIPDILASWLDGTTENRQETEDSQRLHLLNDTRYCTCYFMLLFLPETLGAVINVGYYETPEGFCCADGHSHPEGKKKNLSFKKRLFLAV